MDEHEENRETTKERILKILKKHKLKFMVLFLCVKEVLDCLFDWLLYRELSAREPGILYGATNNVTLLSLFIFCCIGTVVSAVDCINKVVELCTGKPIVNTGYTELCVVFLEDIPQLMIGFFIVGCTVENYWLLYFKALFIWCGSLITLMVMMLAVVYPEIPDCSFHSIMCPEHSDDRKTKKCGGLYIGGLIIVFILSWAMIYIIPNSSRNDPLDNVGVYVRTGEVELINDDSENWIYVFDINDIKSHGEIKTKITTNQCYIRIQNIFTGNENDTDTCYRLIQENDTMFERYFDCSLVNGTEVYFHFKYISPSRRHLLGDIQYNTRKTSNGSCGNETSEYRHVKYFNGSRYETEIQGDDSIRENSLHHLYGIWKYSRSGYNNSDARYKFHSISNNLEDLKNHWRTKFCNILNTSPDFNPDIPISCTP